jgi:thymidylate kinase
MARQLATRSHTKETAAVPACKELPESADRRGLRLWLTTLRVLLIARERRRNLVIARQARNRGMVVIADRYPQTQFLDMMDSPHLSQWQYDSNQCLRAVAAWETRVYESAATPAPDLVIKLCVDPQIAHQRKGDQTMPSLTRRCQIVRDLAYPPATRTVAIDANLPLEHVLVEAKRAIWNLL